MHLGLSGQLQSAWSASQTAPLLALGLAEAIHLGLKPIAKAGDDRSGPIFQYQPGEFGHRDLDVQGKVVKSCLELI